MFAFLSLFHFHFLLIHYDFFFLYISDLFHWRLLTSFRMSLLGTSLIYLESPRVFSLASSFLDNILLWSKNLLLFHFFYRNLPSSCIFNLPKMLDFDSKELENGLIIPILILTLKMKKNLHFLFLMIMGWICLRPLELKPLVIIEWLVHPRLQYHSL